MQKFRDRGLKRTESPRREGSGLVKENNNDMIMKVEDKDKKKMIYRE